MSEYTHTPGQWRWEARRNHDGECHYWIDCRETHVGGMYIDTIAECYETGRGSAKANARLIAAAPDLAALLAGFAEVRDGRCTSCHSAPDAEGHCGGCPPIEGSAWYKLRCRARVALQKAGVQ